MVIHIDQSHSVDYPIDKFPKLLSELDGEIDIEKYVALTHESEWCLSVAPNNLLILNNNFDELDDSWYMENVANENIIKLWCLLAIGNVDKIKAEQWIYGDPIFGI